MCELCELKAKADKKREAYSFRIMQMPKRRSSLRSLLSRNVSTS